MGETLGRAHWRVPRKRRLPTVECPRWLGRYVASGAFVWVALAARPGSVSARPQFGVALLPGVCGVAEDQGVWQRTAFFGAARGDVLLGRGRSADLGLGPFVEASTAGFSDVRLAGGASALVPVSQWWPLVVSAGGYVRPGREGFQPGFTGSLFWGLRDYNYHASYSSAVGLQAGVYQGLGGGRENVVFVAAHLDALLLSVPFVVAYEGLTH